MGHSDPAEVPVLVQQGAVHEKRQAYFLKSGHRKCSLPMVGKIHVGIIESVHRKCSWAFFGGKVAAIIFIGHSF